MKITDKRFDKTDDRLLYFFIATLLGIEVGLGDLQEGIKRILFSCAGWMGVF